MVFFRHFIVRLNWVKTPQFQGRFRADSNRCTRFCRPLPSHSATEPNFGLAAYARLTANPGAKVLKKTSTPHFILLFSFLFALFKLLFQCRQNAKISESGFLNFFVH